MRLQLDFEVDERVLQEAAADGVQRAFNRGFRTERAGAGVAALEAALAKQLNAGILDEYVRKAIAAILPELLREELRDRARRILRKRLDETLKTKTDGELYRVAQGAIDVPGESIP